MATQPGQLHGLPEWPSLLLGGRPCLDFANTVDWDAEFGYSEPERTDVLISGPWVGRWARRVGIPGRGRISEREVERLRGQVPDLMEDQVEQCAVASVTVVFRRDVNGGEQEFAQ